MGVWVEGLHQYIVYIGPDGKTQVGRQGPGSGRPGHKKDLFRTDGIRRIQGLEKEFTGIIPDGLEHSHGGSILYILIATRLVELVRAEAGAGGRRIRLDADTLVQK